MLNQFKVVRLLCIIVFLIISMSSYAKNYHEMSIVELQQLPPFCQSWYKGYRNGSAIDLQKYQMWQKKLGGIPEPHHLCPGLNALNISYKFKKKSPSKRAALTAALNNLGYVLGHHKEKFPIKSTILLKRGKVYEDWDKLGKAMADYQEAIRIKPNNVHAYVSTAGIYLKLNSKADARNIINQGLKIKPGSKVLLGWKKRLGK